MSTQGAQNESGRRSDPILLPKANTVIQGKYSRECTGTCLLPLTHGCHGQDVDRLAMHRLASAPCLLYQRNVRGIRWRLLWDKLVGCVNRYNVRHNGSTSMEWPEDVYGGMPGVRTDMVTQQGARHGGSAIEDGTNRSINLRENA